MVSIVLLTTEEVLQMNGFWYRLDSTWVTEEMEPFDEVKTEDLYVKPISRDVYYAKFPDIPRSESEDEYCLSFKGFKKRHQEWKTKLQVRKFDAQRRSISKSQITLRIGCSNGSINNESRRVTSLVEMNKEMEVVKETRPNHNDDRVNAFLTRLLENIPPPPITDTPQDKTTNTNDSSTDMVIDEQNFQDIDVPDYTDFAKINVLNSTFDNDMLPVTSTLKKSPRKVSFNLNNVMDISEDSDPWYDSLYGLSDMDTNFNGEKITPSTEIQKALEESNECDRFPSWSEILNECGICDSIVSGKESLVTTEEIITQSHFEREKIIHSFQDDADEELCYARFAIYKIHQTVKLDGKIIDSSSLHDLKFNNDENLERKTTRADRSFYGAIYSLMPQPLSDSLESPPENELQKNSDRVLSEHELRVQRSLQKLNVPEWYKNAPAPREGFLLRKRLSDASASATRWSGLNSKTTSLGSLGGGNAQPPPPQLSPHTTSFGRWSTSRLNSNQTSPCSSTRSSIRGTSPLCSPSTRSSFSARQPYLGWRSQERLNNVPRTPHERLASSLLQTTAASRASEEIQSSIKEVTSAIVHYVSGLEPANGDIDRDVSPRSSQKLYWLESSFVGTKPLESPQTPLVVSEALPPPHPRPPSSLRLDHRAAPDWQDSQRSLNLGIGRPSPGSTTLEDVLDSLLGLPSQPTRIPTPQPSPRKSTSPYYMMGGKSPRYEQLASSGHSSASPASRFVSTPSDGPSSFTDPSPDHDRQDNIVDTPTVMHESRRPHSSQGDHSRRKSEPYAQNSVSLDRRTSLDVGTMRSNDCHLTRNESKASLTSVQTDNSTDDALVKCKYPKCPSRAPLADAKRHYKTCHNCSTMYCSRECRRGHWEKHRKVCLYSRASALCRQIISAAKEDPDSLHQISSIAHRGYLTHGRGVVKVFFTSPEAAEKFTTHGYQYLREPEFMKWTSLQPNEMGVELYTEVVKLCKTYNPETRVILYVAVCIISEVPTKGAVKWERQMVSRCAKLRLSKTVTAAIQEQNRRRHRRNSKGTPEDRETLILKSKLLNSSDKNAATAHKFRQICFQNISNELEVRGVLLKKHFPEVYSRLVAYVDGTSDRFIPMTIYPKDVTSGKSFMCIIMPDSEVENDIPGDGKVTTVDIGVDRSRHQLSTPM